MAPEAGEVLQGLSPPPHGVVTKTMPIVSAVGGRNPGRLAQLGKNIPKIARAADLRAQIDEANETAAHTETVEVAAVPLQKLKSRVLEKQMTVRRARLKEGKGQNKFVKAVAEAARKHAQDEKEKQDALDTPQTLDEIFWPLVTEEETFPRAFEERDRKVQPFDRQQTKKATRRVEIDRGRESRRIAVYATDAASGVLVGTLSSIPTGTDNIFGSRSAPRKPAKAVRRDLEFDPPGQRQQILAPTQMRKELAKKSGFFGGLSSFMWKTHWKEWRTSQKKKKKVLSSQLNSMRGFRPEKLGGSECRHLQGFLRQSMQSAFNAEAWAETGAWLDPAPSGAQSHGRHAERQRQLGQEAAAFLKDRKLAVNKDAPHWDDMKVELTEKDVRLRQLAKMTHVPIVDVECIHAEFCKFDADNSGFLDRDEFRNMLVDMHRGVEPTKSQLQSALHAVDEDGSGEIDFDEFFVWYANQYLSGFYT